MLIFFLPDITRLMKSRTVRWPGHMAHMGEKKNAYGNFTGKPRGKGLLSRPLRGWEDNIKMDLKEIGWKGVDWINLANNVGK